MNRRAFLTVTGAAGVHTWLGTPRLPARRRNAAPMPMCQPTHPSERTAAPGHPTPRPGITGAKVLVAARLLKWPDRQKTFDGIRAIPQIADGIRCGCGCAELPGYYSLLSCYEGDDAMAMICPICQGAGKLTVRLHGEGRSLAEIRVAVDAQFG